jgi:hypothetical protein
MVGAATAIQVDGREKVHRHTAWAFPSDVSGADIEGGGNVGGARGVGAGAAGRHPMEAWD